ncbi:MAG TPA: hypothetical protein VFI42_11100 [Thermomicrobiaceae bacterium]|nr:hypothetical protein [Thermomicrobiaceae bacterium]
MRMHAWLGKLPLLVGLVASGALLVALSRGGPDWLEVLCFVVLLFWLVVYRLVTPTDSYHDRVYDYAEFMKSGGFHTRAWIDGMVERPTSDEPPPRQER